MDMSFYGGKQGKSFRISKVFQNKAELIRDLNARWNSSIGINELVFINYGNPGNKDIVVHTGEIIEIDGQKLPPAPKDLTLFEKNRFIDFNYEFSVYDEEQGQYVTKADGKLFNTTVWQKIYKDDIPIKTDTKIDPIKGIDRYMISDDFGVGYELVACLTGNTPEISVESSWIYTDQEPRAYLNKEKYDAEKPLIHFDLPKGITLLYGPELTNRNATELRLDVTEKFGTGDYYINNTNGNTYLCTAVGAQVNGKKIYTVKYVATLAREVDEVTIESVNPYVSVDGSWKQQNAGVQNTINDETWNIKFTLPKLPTLSTSVSELLSPANRQRITVTGAIKDENTYNFAFALAKPSVWLNGADAPENAVTGEDGDYYLNTETQDVSFKNNGAWNLVTNIKGAQGIQGVKGDNVAIVNSFDFVYDATVTGYVKVEGAENTYRGNLDPNSTVDLVKFGEIAVEVNGNKQPKSSDLFNLNYTNIEGEENAYWLFKLTNDSSNNKWSSMRVTGNAGSLAILLMNEFDAENRSDKTYTTGYINNKFTEEEAKVDEKFSNFTIDNMITTAAAVAPKGGEFTFDIGEGIIKADQKVIFNVTKDDDTVFDTAFSNIQKQINDFKNATIDIAHGGTGGTTAEQARTNLGVYSKTEVYNKAEINTKETALQESISNVEDKAVRAQTAAESATTIALNFTIPLKSSGTGTWTTVEGKTRVVLNIEHGFTDANKQPMVVCKDSEDEPYQKIEEITFDTGNISIIMSEENKVAINLFAFYPQ